MIIIRNSNPRWRLGIASCRTCCIQTLSSPLHFFQIDSNSLKVLGSISI
uniref:Uncharacterized protein n=1 Tax=Anguilla anguilla TaxID=7936 RepID=A0A0E9WGS8_ANGAN